MKKYWDRIRKIGKPKFIVLYALIFGILLALFSSLIAMLANNNFNISRLYSADAFGMLAGGFLGGLISGTAHWYNLENKTRTPHNPHPPI